mmetsp:Transcript_57632/g.62266  ORF Transcript_57632/g.62266 Transcript_57632/m.62266 type:complete len:403 (-) Transcript_57632:204-1412(-)
MITIILLILLHLIVQKVNRDSYGINDTETDTDTDTDCNTNAAATFLSSKTPLLAELLLINQQIKSNGVDPNSLVDVLSTTTTVSLSSPTSSSTCGTLFPVSSSLQQQQQQEQKKQQPMMMMPSLSSLSLLSGVSILTSCCCGLFAAVYGLSGVVGVMLTQYEWVQTWRYIWPLFIGLYFWYDAYLLLLASSSLSSSSSMLSPQQQITITNTDASPDTATNTAATTRTSTAFHSKTNGITSTTTITTTTVHPNTLVVVFLKAIVGIGLVVGGLADAVLPIWVTGPNLVTHSGMGPDCAVLLLGICLGEDVVQVLYNLGNNNSNNDNNNNDNDNDNGNDNGIVNNTQRKIMNVIALSPTYSSMASMAMSSSSSLLLLLLLRITLWTELYKLGESSFDEIMSFFQ